MLPSLAFIVMAFHFTVKDIYGWKIKCTVILFMSFSIFEQPDLSQSSNYSKRDGTHIVSPENTSLHAVHVSVCDAAKGKQEGALP